ncbi:MAG: kelch repeat-containing protein [Candidatus Thorarchaeota archaeon]
MKIRILIISSVLITLIASTILVGYSDCLQVTGDPGLRSAHSMVFDPYNGVAVMFGGTSFEGGIHALGDTWIYSYPTNTWTELMLRTNPPARANAAMVYCNETNEIILFGGFGYTDTWSMNCYTQIWSEVETTTNPGVHHSLDLAYDPQSNCVILFGGFNVSGWDTDDTWKFNCTSREWTELEPTTVPLARYGHVMAYDESINLIVLTNGNTAYQGHQDDTWTFNVTANTWTEVTTISEPDPLKWPAMTYDSVNQRCIVFGGQIGDNAMDRTWLYNAQTRTWQNINPDDAPSARINTALAFDPRCEVTILYGGMDTEGPQYGDTWVYRYDNNTWLDMSENDPHCSVTTTTESSTTTSIVVTTNSSSVTTTSPTSTITSSSTITTTTTPILPPSSDILLIVIASTFVIAAVGIIVYILRRSS